MNQSMDRQLPGSAQEFEEMSLALALEFIQVLNGRTLHTGVLMHALMRVHQANANLLPESARKRIAVGMAAYAGELLQKGPGANAALTPVSPFSQQLH